MVYYIYRHRARADCYTAIYFVLMTISLCLRVFLINLSADQDISFSCLLHCSYIRRVICKYDATKKSQVDRKKRRFGTRARAFLRIRYVYIYIYICMCNSKKYKNWMWDYTASRVRFSVRVSLSPPPRHIGKSQWNYSTYR